MKNSKRFLAMMTAGFLAITPMAATGLTAYAVTHSLTVTDTDTATHTYTAYPIILGTKNTDGSLTGLSWAANVDSDALISALTTNAGVLGITMPASTTVDNIAETLASITGDDRIEKLAKILNTAAIRGTTGTSLTKDGNNYSATVDDGWYLVVDETTLATATDTTSTQVRSANLLQIVGDTSLSAKHSLPTLEKKIVEGSTEVDYNTAAIGDVITYHIKTKVPDTTGYNKYFFIVEDTLSAGLTYNASSINVKIYDKDDSTVLKGTLTKDADTDYTNYATDDADYYVLTGGTPNLKIVFEDVINNFASYDAGDDIVIEYTATLNSNASIDPTVGNPNTAKLKYSNDPNVDYTGTPGLTPDEPGGSEVVGETPNDKVNTYTTAIKIKKVDQDGNPLKGAEFTLEGVKLNKVETVTGSTFTKDNTNGTYWKLNNGSYTTTNPADLTTEQQAKYESTSDKYVKTTASATELTATGDPKSITATVDDDGYLTFTGLDAGDYTLKESNPPSGYNKAADISFTLSASSISENSVTWTNSKSSTKEENMFVHQIENRKGSILPTTGGIGTKLFYIIGGLLVAGSVVLLVTKKRMKANED
ncbi:isopeptide-forming domain-containing fimbrial protein [Ruminococcus sp.]|uniref:isopeptide-forming domain-containing fimbrial protein n=1 Tax=Ruminococcus sp. TaxID=41978 RepID=UPI0025EDB56F|nr:isopeptide-forming domain-containing fimbrial protein [Ruminococcus sp.]